MQNLKYHLLNIFSVILFSYLTAVTINKFFKLGFDPTAINTSGHHGTSSQQNQNKPFSEYQSILDSGFFKIADESSDTASSEAVTPDNLADIMLLGTITGPPYFSRALIKKKSDKDSQTYKLNADVFGYKLVRIDNTTVHLKSGNKVYKIYLFAQTEADSKSAAANPKAITKTISRTELQNTALNNMDNALKGIKAGPYRVDGKIEGYKIFNIQPSNMLYNLGLRSGDIVKRVNGKVIDSTQTLITMWNSFKSDSAITIDVQRGTEILNYNLNIKN